MLEHGAYLWGILNLGAQLYVCGNKNNLERAIEQALKNIAMNFGQLDEDDAQAFVDELSAGNRLHKEVY